MSPIISHGGKEINEEDSECVSQKINGWFIMYR
jgi:hypothetical protein